MQIGLPMKRLFMCLAAMLGTLFTIAAQEVEFTADRPGASTGPAVVGLGVAQWEQGMAAANDGGSMQYTLSNTLLRYGLFEGVEVRLGGDALLYEDAFDWRGAFSGLSVGTKIRCYEGSGFVPAISLMATLSVPHTGSAGFVTDHLTPSLHLLFENGINDWLSIGYDVGVDYDGTFAAPTTFAAVCFGATLSDRLGCFAESYNCFSEWGNAYCADFGLSYMLAPKVQLDFAVDMDLARPTKCWAVSFGVAWQIN